MIVLIVYAIIKTRNTKKGKRSMRGREILVSEIENPTAELQRGDIVTLHTGEQAQILRALDTERTVFLVGIIEMDPEDFDIVSYLTS